MDQLNCDQCNFRATNKGNLTAHMKSKHEGIKYPCAQCDYEAKWKGNLSAHIRSHHKGLKYSCEQCDYKATVWYPNLVLEFFSLRKSSSLEFFQL